MRRPLEDTARHFDGAAETYDREAGEWLRRAQDLCVRLLDVRPGDVVLDVGCGTGTVTAAVAPRARRVIGIDISEGMLDQATRKLERFNNAAVGRGSFQHPEEAFDFEKEGLTKIVSCFSLRHLDAQEKRVSIERLASLLPAGGVIVVGDVMFFDGQDGFHDLYDPQSDEPAEVRDLLAMFRLAGCEAEAHRLHPAVGVIRAVVGER